MPKATPTWREVEGYSETRYRTVDWSNDLERVRSLFEQYRQWITDHAEQGEASGPRVNAGVAALDELIQRLPGAYGPPRGEVLLWFKKEALVACGALRELEPEIGELKRIYIRADFRGEEFGKLFVRALIDKAQELGYRRLRSYALGSMSSALEFYEELGFRRIPAYWSHPASGTVFFEFEFED